MKWNIRKQICQKIDFRLSWPGREHPVGYVLRMNDGSGEWWDMRSRRKTKATMIQPSCEQIPGRKNYKILYRGKNVSGYSNFPMNTTFEWGHRHILKNGRAQNNLQLFLIQYRVGPTRHVVILFLPYRFYRLGVPAVKFSIQQASGRSNDIYVQLARCRNQSATFYFQRHHFSNRTLELCLLIIWPL